MSTRAIVCIAVAVWLVAAPEASLAWREYAVRPGSWQDLYPKLFNVREQAPNVTPEQARRLIEGLRLELDDKTFPVGQKKEAQFWLDAAELDERKCRRSYDEHLLRRYKSVYYAPSLERWNLKVLVDDIRLKQLKFCLSSKAGVDFVDAIESIPTSAMDEIESFDGLPEASRQLSFMSERLRDQCNSVIKPMGEFSDLAEYILHEDFERHLNNSGKFKRWRLLVDLCKSKLAQTQDKPAGLEPEAWPLLFQRMFAVDEFKADMTALETREVMRKLGQILAKDAKNTMINEDERREVEFWLDASKLDAPAKCRRSFDELLDMQVARVKICKKQQRWNLKTYARDLKYEQLTCCLRSKVATELLRTIESIPERDGRLVRSIATRSGLLSKMDVLNTMLPFYEPTVKLFGLKGRMRENSFLSLYEREIVKPCRFFLEPLSSREAFEFVDYIGQDEYRMLLDRTLRDWLDYVPACKRIVLNKNNLRDVVSKELNKAALG